MKKTFSGVAYWAVDTTAVRWAASALDVLLPLEAAGLAQIQLTFVAAGDQLTIVIASETLHVLVNGGKGRGVVPPSPVAGSFVVCLMALSKQLGDITVVDDAQNEVPKMLRQQYPLFRDSWKSVLEFAEALSLVPSQQVVAAMRNMII